MGAVTEVIKSNLSQLPRNINPASSLVMGVNAVCRTLVVHVQLLKFLAQ